MNKEKKSFVQKKSENAEKDYFDHQIMYRAPICESKYTTKKKS